MEKWKTIKDCPEYAISNQGRVMYLRLRKIRKLSKHKGYSRIRIRNVDNILVNKRVGRLVAEAFIPNPNNDPIVDHINRDRSNNNIDNLRWVNHKQSTINRTVTRVVTHQCRCECGHIVTKVRKSFTPLLTY